MTGEASMEIKINLGALPNGLGRQSIIPARTMREVARGIPPSTGFSRGTSLPKRYKTSMAGSPPWTINIAPDEALVEEIKKWKREFNV